MLKRRGKPNTKIPYDDLPNQARFYRIKQDFTLEELSRRIFSDPNSLSAFERKGTGIIDAKRWALAEVLEVEYSVLMTPGKNFAKKIRKSLDFIRK